MSNLPPANQFPYLAAISRRKLSEWCLGKRARVVGGFVVSQSFDKGRMGVRMFNRHIEAALGMDKGCVSDAIRELVGAGVMQVVGRSGAARIFRFLPNAELVEPESRVDAVIAAGAIAEIDRLNADGLGMEATGQRVLPIRTDDEIVSEELAEGSAARALDEGCPEMREKILESFRSAGWAESDLQEFTRTNGAGYDSACQQLANNLPDSPSHGRFARQALGSQPSHSLATAAGQLAESQAVSILPDERKAAPAHVGAHPRNIGTIGNGTTVPHWNQCGAKSRRTNGEARKIGRRVVVDEDLLRRVEEVVGVENRGYWAALLIKEGQTGPAAKMALHEALGEYKLGGGAPPGANKSRYLFGIYRRCKR